MRTASRGAASLALSVVLAPSALVLLASPASADTAAPPAVKTHWYWSLAAPSVGGNALPAGAPSQASGVPDGDLGVGYTADQVGNADKTAAAAFDLSGVPSGSTFTSFKATFPYDPSAHQLAQGVPDISACELLDAFADAPGPSDPATTPPLSLPSCVKGTFVAAAGAAGGFVFDLTAIANDWSGGAPANGVLLRPTPNLARAQQPFSVSFQGKNAISVQAEYVPPAAPAPVPVPPAAAPGPALPPPPLPAFAANPGVAPAPAPLSAPLPAPAPQRVAAPQVVPVVQAATYRPGALVPSGAWWAAFLGLAALLALAAAALADPLAPVPVDPRRRRFAAVVAPARAAAGPSARPRRAAPRLRSA